MAGSYVRTKEHREKMSQILKGRERSKQHCENLSLAMKKRWRESPKEMLKALEKRGEDWRKKISETKKKLYQEGRITIWCKGLTKETDYRVAKISEAQKNRVHSEEHNRRVSETRKRLFKEGKIVNYWKGKHLPEETKQKLSKSRKGKYCGKNSPMFGRHLSEEAKKILSEKAKKRWLNDEYRQNITEKNKARWQDPKHRARMLEIVRSDEIREKLSRITKRRWQNPEFKERVLKIFNTEDFKQKISHIHKGQKFSEEHCRKIGEAHRKLWDDSEFREAHIKQAREKTKLQWQNPKFRKMHEEKMANGCLKKMLIALNKRPTNLEKQFMAICDKYGLPFEYVGDGDFFVGSKNPDFIHTNGDKVCVEVANTCPIHHSKDYPIIRKRYFAEYGWDCVVFMGNKLDENVVMNQLSPFVETR